MPGSTRKRWISRPLPGRSRPFVRSPAESRNASRAQNIFSVPPELCWAHLEAQAKQPTIGQLAMAGIERDNPALKGVLPNDYARPALDKTRVGQLIDLISEPARGASAPAATAAGGVPA